MANICVSKIAVIGLKEPPEEFVKKLSKLMFDIDLDDIDVAKWGLWRCEGGKLVAVYRFVGLDGQEETVRREFDGDYDASNLVEGKFYDVKFDWTAKNPLEKKSWRIEQVDGNMWYAKVAREMYPPLCILVPAEPFVIAGISVPRFRVETKWKPPYEKLLKASEALPDLTFSLGFWIEQDGPTGEIVIRAGKEIEHDVTPESWYLFDKIKHPRLPLLLRHIPMTLAQRGQSAIETARDFVEQVRRVLHDRRFTGSPYDEYRDPKAVSEAINAVDALLAHCETAATALTFKGVFLSDDDVARLDKLEDLPETDACEVPADFEELPKKWEQTAIGLVEEYL